MSRLPYSSQIPHHLISDAHEWMNESPAVPTCISRKPQPREPAGQNQRGSCQAPKQSISFLLGVQSDLVAYIILCYFGAMAIKR